MRANRLQAIWSGGGAALNGWLHIPSAWSAEVMAHAGWDSVTVDMQHGMMGVETAIVMLQALSTTDIVPLVRVNWNEPGIIMKMLDAGAMGVICPMIDTREGCEAFVGAVRYPPLGYRSLGPTRARVYAGADYADGANDTVLAIAMVETAAGLENVEAIAATPGLDGIMIGAGDLRLSLFGEVGLDGQGAALKASLRRILDACTANNIVGGIFTASPAYAREMTAEGFRFVTVMSDTMMLSAFAKQVVDEARGTS